MARMCELTGVKTLFGQNVSHSNRKTKTRFVPNLCNVNLVSNALNKSIKLTITTRALRSVDARGGLDGFLLSRSARQLTDKAKGLRKSIEKSLGKQTK